MVQPKSMLAVIASYGRSQDAYLHRVVAEYYKLAASTRVVVLSNLHKCVPGAEVLVGLPSPDPYSLPFAHKKVFAENSERFDLFVYSEDDTLITGRHVESFVRAQSWLKEDEIAGFIRSESSPDGSKFITSIHHHFRWLPGSVVERSGEVFAALSNDHSGCYMITRELLRTAIRSGRFLAAPRSGEYGMLETAATDVYTQCGLRRLICVSKIRDFIVEHLPNKYHTWLGIGGEDLLGQVETLVQLQLNGGWTGQLFEPATHAPGFRWSKDLYERCDERLLRAIPSSAKNVLSVGCGWGQNEAWLRRQGMNVCAVPLDVVFAASLRRRGIRCVVGPLAGALDALSGERFDVVLTADVLHLLPEPVEWLRQLGQCLLPGGAVVASVANTGEWCALSSDQFQDWRRLGRRGGDWKYEGVQKVTLNRLHSWFESAGLRAVRVVPALDGERGFLRRLGTKALGAAFAPRFVVTATLPSA